MLVEIVDDVEIARRARSLILAREWPGQFAARHGVPVGELARLLVDGRVWSDEQERWQGAVDWIAERPRVRRELGL